MPAWVAGKLAELVHPRVFRQVACNPSDSDVYYVNSTPILTSEDDPLSRQITGSISVVAVLNAHRNGIHSPLLYTSTAPHIVV